MIRPFRTEDAAAVLALTRELLPLRVETLETVLYEASRGPSWLAVAGGEVVGAARLRAGKLTLGVARRARRRGIGTALWEAAGAGVESAWAADGEGVRFARRRGFVPSRRVVVAALDLREAAAQAPVPRAGAELVRWPELDSVPVELGADEHLAFPALLAEASWAAVAGGTVVAYALVAADDRGLGESHYTFTLPGYRGRGLATLCKQAAAASARELGLHTLTAGNDETNAAMRAINAKLGYRPRQLQTTLARAGGAE